MYQLTRRQAEAFEIQARRVLNAGHNTILVPGTDAGTVRANQGASEPSEDDTAPPSIEEQAQARARRIKAESAGVAAASIAGLRSRLSVLERNIRAGYGAEWSADHQLTKRTLELVEGVTTV